MARRVLIAFAFVGLASVLSCGTSKTKMDDTAGTGESAEVVQDTVKEGEVREPEDTDAAECSNLDQEACEASDVCMAIEGWAKPQACLVWDDDAAGGASEFVACVEAGLCGASFTWARPPDSEDEVWLFPSTCMPTGWMVVDEAPCCHPDCEGKECGDDGCGGTCGECPYGTVCASGGNCADCMETLGLEGGLGTPCEDGTDCIFYDFCVALDGSDDKICTCSCQDECPAPFECVAVAHWFPDVFFGCFPPCEPDCAGKECGDDGCGGSCGGCGEEEQCLDGQCHTAGGCSASISSYTVFRLRLLGIGSGGHPGEALNLDGLDSTCSPAGDCEQGLDNYLTVAGEFIGAADPGDPSCTVALADGFNVDGLPFSIGLASGKAVASREECDWNVENCVHQVQETSLEADTCEPYVLFLNATVVGGHLQAGGPGTVLLWKPFPDQELTIEIYHVQLAADVQSGGGDVWLTDVVWGFGFDLNKVNAEVCAAAGDDLPIPCDKVKDMLGPGNSADLDIDGDEEADVYSVGVKFAGRPATLGGTY